MKLKDLERDVIVDVQIACKFMSSNWVSSKVILLTMSVGEPTYIQIQNVYQTDKGRICLNMQQSMQFPSNLIQTLHKKGVNQFIDIKMKANDEEDAQKISFKWYFITVT